MSEAEVEKTERAANGEDSQENGGDTLTRQLLEQTQQELAETKDRYMRALADLANLKKRMAQETQDCWQRGAISILEELLPILDNFERAMAAMDENGNVSSLQEGVTMIYNQLQNALRKRGVEPIEAMGRQFDPFWHEAAGQVHTDEAEEGSVVGEIQRGYKIGDRVVRPSRVAVATKLPEES